MALHHPLLCTFRLWSASLQAASPRALQLQCKSSTDKLIITQKLGAAPTASRHHNKHDNNIVTIGPKAKGEGKNKGKQPMHVLAPRPTSGGSSDSGGYSKGTPPRPIMPIYHHTKIDRHLWESDSTKLPDDIEGSLEPKTSIHIDKLIGKGVPEWFVLEMLNELTKYWPYWKNVEWTMKDRSPKMSKDIKGEVQNLRGKQKVTLELVLKLQADIVAGDNQERPRSSSHPPPPHSHKITKHPSYPPQ